MLFENETSEEQYTDSHPERNHLRCARERGKGAAGVPWTDFLSLYLVEERSYSSWDGPS